MIFGYAETGLTPRAKGFLLAVSAVTIPLAAVNWHSSAAPAPTQIKPIASPPKDARVERLRSFLHKLHCPVASLSEDFVRVADENKLDWRLLPSIAVIESGGGKAYKNNNIFGWNGGEQQFATILSGLELVAYKLAHSPLYQRRSNLEKLRIYNENEEYADSVMAVMRRISPRVM